MKDTELISIIVPVYNVEGYIDECINSIVNQTYKNLEIILVDDGSTDGSGKKCDEWEKKDARIKVIHQGNQGASMARNAGLELATGCYIGFIDSDDYICSDMYESMYNNIKKEDADMSICGIYIDRNGKITNDKFEDIYLVMNKVETYKYLFKPGYFKYGANDKLYKADIIRNLRFPNGRKNGEDLQFMYNIIERCRKNVYDSTPKYYYRQRSNSITHTKKIGFGLVESSKEMLEFFKENYPKLYNTVATRYVLALFQYYNNCLELRDFKDENFKFVKKELVAHKKNIDKTIMTRGKLMQLKFFYYCRVVYNVVAGFILRRRNK